MKAVKVSCIILLVILIFCSCCGIASFIGLRSAYSVILKEGKSLKNEIFDNLCSKRGTLTKAEYEKWFSSEYKKETSYEETKDYLDKAFSSGYSCKNLLGSSILEMIKGQQSLSVSTNNGNKKVELTFKNSNGKFVKFTLIEENEKLKIRSLEILEKQDK